MATVSSKLLHASQALSNGLLYAVVFLHGWIQMAIAWQYCEAACANAAGVKGQQTYCMQKVPLLQSHAQDRLWHSVQTA